MYNSHSISFVSFANSRYASQNRIKSEAEEMHFFDHIYVGDEKMLESWYYEKYKDRGVMLLGIDPIDDPVKDEMADFLAKRGISYTVLFSERELSSTYRIVAYPTLFFIDRDGIIAKVHRGYHPSLEEAIEEQLQKML